MHTVLRAFFGYFYLLFLVRVLARRPGAQMTPFEFVLIFLIGGIIILASADDDHSMINCIGGVVTVALLHRSVSYLKQRYPKFAAVVDGSPVVLLKRDQWQMEALHVMNVDEADVMAAARTKGLRRLDQIKYAILERNGGISIIPKSES